MHVNKRETHHAGTNIKLSTRREITNTRMGMQRAYTSVSSCLSTPQACVQPCDQTGHQYTVRRWPVSVKPCSDQALQRATWGVRACVRCVRISSPGVTHSDHALVCDGASVYERHGTTSRSLTLPAPLGQFRAPPYGPNPWPPHAHRHS